MTGSVPAGRGPAGMRIFNSYSGTVNLSKVKTELTKIFAKHLAYGGVAVV
jgi:hypothetical protein